MVAATPVLHPMRVAELLDATIRLYRKNFLLLVAIVAVVQVPLLVLNGALTVPLARAQQEMATYPTTPSSDDLGLPAGMGRYFLRLGIQLAVTGTIGVIGGSLMTGALAWAISQRHREQPVTVGRAYGAVLRRWRPLLGSTALVLLLDLALLILVLVPCLGWVFAPPVFLFTVVCLRLTPQTVMLENCSASDALRRSWFLTKPQFWRVFGILALLWILSTALTAGPSYLVSFGQVALGASRVVGTVLSFVTSTLLALIYIPIQRGAETLVYYDLRVRREGLDLETELDALALPAAEQPGEPQAMPASFAAAPAATREPLLTGRDWGNIAILLGVAVGLVVAACILIAILQVIFTAAMLPYMRESLEQIMTRTPVP